MTSLAASTKTKKQKRLTDFFGNQNLPIKAKRPRESNFSTCPICQISFPRHRLESHASNCDGEKAKSPASLSKTKDKKIPCSEEPLPGLFIYENFITLEEEEMIINYLDCLDVVKWKASRFNGKKLGKRWGVHCNLRDRRVDAPEWSLPDVITRILFPKLKMLGFSFSPNEANSIDYRRSQGHWLQAHVDDRQLSKEPIANLSLAGDCYMTFRNQSKHRNLAVSEKKILLKRRCLQVLTGNARYDFSHGIDHKDLLSERRISVTMRESPLT